MKKPRLLFFVLGVALSVGCKKQNDASPPQTQSTGPGAAHPGETAKGFTPLTLAELEEKMAAARGGTLKLAVFDNNGRDTYEQGHLPGASWVQYDEIKASDLPADKDTHVVFYCYNEH